MKIVRQGDTKGKSYRKYKTKKNTRGDIRSNQIEEKPQKTAIPRTRMYLVVDDIENVNEN